MEDAASRRERNLYDPFRRAVASALPEGRGEGERNAALVGDAGKLLVVRIEFDTVGVPHGKLAFHVAAVGAAGLWVPRPAALRIEPVELAFQNAGGHAPRVAFEVAIDVVGVSLRFGERPVEKETVDSDLPELTSKRFCLVNEVSAPRGVPVLSPC